MPRADWQSRKQALDGELEEWNAIWDSKQRAKEALWAERPPELEAGSDGDNFRSQPAMPLTELAVTAIQPACRRALFTAALDIALPALLACACL